MVEGVHYEGGHHSDTEQDGAHDVEGLPMGHLVEDGSFPKGRPPGGQSKDAAGGEEEDGRADEDGSHSAVEPNTIINLLP